MELQQRRIATEQVVAEIDGINTVVAEPGLPVPLAYDHLVPDNKTTTTGVGPTRSTAGRRAAAAAAASEADEPKTSRRRASSTPEDAT